jgi:hypothetical protein
MDVVPRPVFGTDDELIAGSQKLLAEGAFLA